MEDTLCPNGKDPFNRVQNEKSPSVSGTTDEYEIERIVDKRLRNVRGKKITEYLLRWKGYVKTICGIVSRT
jgi:hypothetical protein